jgi:cyclopropane-fatty-acyl-phospholipid synthase
MISRGLPSPSAFAVMAVLRRLRSGTLAVVMPDGSERVFRGRTPGPTASIEVLDRTLPRRLAVGGAVALGETYMDGAWDTTDLDALLALGLANADAGRGVDVLAPLRRLLHPARETDLEGAKRNVAYHYDLGNDFYSLWLDPTMTYSAACFDAGTDDLEAAQRRKWERVLELVQPRSGDRILDIGCGWGGFAIHAAEEAGCHVTGLTLSVEQAALARERVRQRGLEGRVDIRLRDYRRETGRYRGVASIEMFEAVGERGWPTFFGRLRELLEPGAAAGLQVITIAEESFERYRRRPDFTQRYIFPGGMLPSPGRFFAAARDAGLRAGGPSFFGKDYALTLAAWADRFERALPDVRALGFDERFVRMWRYYLAYCRAGFASGNVDVMQVRLEG